MELRTLEDGQFPLERALLSFLAHHVMSLSSTHLMSSYHQLLEANTMVAGHTSPSAYKMTLLLLRPLQPYLLMVSTKDKLFLNM
jgi:hypothetical protein